MNGFGSVMKLASDRGANRRKAGKARTELQEAK